ncbi:MAG TPA: hypothetical protein PKN54_02350 [Candidatus Cloacimonas acidaminovorans]|nr:hypothetical protein [Candidatus Cloacimonas acidaminovorans]
MPCKKNKKRMNQKGSISYWFVFVILVIMLSFLFGVSIPFLQTFTVDIQGVSSDLIDKAQVSALNIKDENSRQAVLDSLNAQESGLAEQQQIYGAFIQYSWILIIVIIAFILFMASRRDVEQNIG